MANETRPRRESTGPSRIRKSSAPPASAPEDADGTAVGADPAMPYGGGSVDAAPPLVEGVRERKEREPFREEGPADREPIRYLRERPERERPEREPGLSVRER